MGGRRVSDDVSASPATVLRTLVARAVDADPGSLADRVEVVERGGEPEIDDGDRLAGATGPIVRRALAERGVDVYRHDGESPVAVVLADERAAVGLIDGNGVAALLTTDDPAVREWAAGTCRRYLDAAEPVTEG